MEFGILILGIPLPEKFQKECGLRLLFLEFRVFDSRLPKEEK